MPSMNSLTSPDLFSAILYEKMKRINAGVEDMELYEFRYALDNLVPEDGGWATVAAGRRRRDREAGQQRRVLRRHPAQAAD